MLDDEERRQGQHEEALGYLEAAHSAEPHNRATQQLLGEAYLANGRLKEGQALWSGTSNDLGQLDLRVAWYRYIGDEQRAGWMEQAIRGEP